MVSTFRRVLPWLTSIAALLAACSSTDGFGTPTTVPEAGLPDATGSSGMAFTTSGGMQTDVIGNVTGRVFAPNGDTPIAGALVYLTTTKPAQTPEQVYCDECVKLPALAPQAITDAKGEFKLGAHAAGKQYVVVQKGGFRRIREVDIAAGEQTLPTAFSTLPAKTNWAAGDEVPRMTVVHGQYDEVEASLKKLGIDPSAIEIVQSALIGVAAKEFLLDAAKVNSRHIIFLPCGDFTQPSPNIDLSADPAIQANLKAFVAAGGRLYASDWHYDFIARTFPGYMNIAGASKTACSGCGKTTYDAEAVLTDPGIAAWMTAQNLGKFTLEKNYTDLLSVNKQSVTVAGVTKEVTPHVWVSGSKAGASAKPATVSFEHGCGKVMFSTYHTEPTSLSLKAQERALLGVLLEVSVCNDSLTGVLPN
jgi:Carboxypeptidase regulatory-like domain